MKERKMYNFISQTKAGLNIVNDDPKICHIGFDFNKLDDNQEDCILVIGLNPAGDNRTVELEKKGRTYFNSFNDDGIKSEYVYNKYYRPIYNLMTDIFGRDVKWPWCNKPWHELESEIERSELVNFKHNIKGEYDKHKNCKYTIYIGDMFYYHETKSKNLPLIKNYDYSTYCKEMLKLHISILRESNKNIKFIYINNSRVSKWLCGNEVKTVCEIDSIKVFFGGMLSSGNMDVFSKKRLVNQIQDELYIQ